MRELRRSEGTAGTDPAFLIKALGEASGELRQAFFGLRRAWLLKEAGPPDDGWCLLALAAHLRNAERGVLGQVEAILDTREPDLTNVDLDDIPLLDDCRGEDEDALLDEFHYLRRHSTYLLWDLSEREWERGGRHPYRGRLTLLEIARELYQHDLGHLWQARRMVEGLRATAR